MVVLNDEYVKNHFNNNFRKGAKSRLLVSDKRITEMENLEEYKEFRIIDLRNNCIKEIKNISNQTNLTHLYLQSNDIERLQGFNALISLEVLYIDFNKIEIIENLDFCPLKKLSARGQRLNEMQMFGFDPLCMERLKGLQKSLMFYSIFKEFAASKGGTEKMKITLNVFGNNSQPHGHLIKKGVLFILAETSQKASSITISTWSSLRLEDEHLEEINISHNNMRTVQDLRCCKKLKILDVSSNKLSNLDKLSQDLSKMENLREIDIQENPVVTYPDFIVQIISKCKNIDRLNRYYISNETRYCCGNIARNKILFQPQPPESLKYIYAAMRSSSDIPSPLKPKITSELLQEMKRKKEAFKKAF